MPAMWYTAQDVMILLGVSRSTAYGIIRSLQDEIVKKQVPNEDFCYSRPPAGKIIKTYFCKKYMLSVKECDKCIQQAQKEVS